MTIRVRPSIVFAIGIVAGASLFLSGSPAASQEAADDSLNRLDSGLVDTLNLAQYSAAELAAIASAAVPGEQIDPWRSGSSSTEVWTVAASRNMSAQQAELARLGLESAASVGRAEVSGLSYGSAVSREQVIKKRLTALVVESFVNGETDQLDKLAGSRARLYIEEPAEVATETISATRRRVEAVATERSFIVNERLETASDMEAAVRLQTYNVDEAIELDAAARRLSMAHPAAIRDRRNQTLEISGEAPETVVVAGFRVSPEIAGPLADMLAAAQANEEGPINLSGWGYRSTEEQINLRINHCGHSAYSIFDGPSPACSPPTARPLHSEHEKGLAIDFTENGAILNSASPAFLWLQENAATYGFFNLPSEPWHWSTTGH